MPATQRRLLAMECHFAALVVFTKHNETEFYVKAIGIGTKKIMKKLYNIRNSSGLQWALEGLAFTVF